MKKYDKIILVLKWIEDIESGEMIERKNYKRSYLGFDRVSQKELDFICEKINPILENYGSSRFITNSMGEIIPTKNNYYK